jgi:hypothetical protein
MRRASTYGIMLLLAAFAIGCDSGDEDRPDSEVFVGSWTVAKIEDAEGDKTAQFQASGTLSTTFGATGTLTIAVDRPAPETDLSVNGTYTVTEPSTLTLNATITNPITGQPVSVPLGVSYAIQSEDEVVLTVDEATIGLIAAAIQLPNIFRGQVRLTIRRA